MKNSIQHQLSQSFVFQGLIIGFLATQALDWIGSLLYNSESDVTRIQEDEGRSHLHVYEVAVDNLARWYGVPLQRKDLAVWGWRFHKMIGVIFGLGYLALRQKSPKKGWSFGLGFGSAFFLLLDEMLMPLLRLSPGPRTFSWKVHLRGAVTHLAYGLVAEAASQGLERIKQDQNRLSSAEPLPSATGLSA